MEFVTVNHPDPFTPNSAHKFRFFTPDPEDHIARHWAAGKFYESAMLDFIAHHFSGDTFIDIGACTGNHSVYFAGVCGAHVISFEPVMQNAIDCWRNVCLNGLSQWVNLHVSALAGPEEIHKSYAMYRRPNSQHNAGMYEARLDSGPLTQSHVFGTLDYFVPEPKIPLLLDCDEMWNWEWKNQVDRVEFIKIDVEGMELEVLRGAAGVIKRDQPGICAELNDAALLEATAFLDELGYSRIDKAFNATATYIFVPEHIQSRSVLTLVRT